MTNGLFMCYNEVEADVKNDSLDNNFDKGTKIAVKLSFLSLKGKHQFHRGTCRDHFLYQPHHGT